jgi:hypothetical protein
MIHMLCFHKLDQLAVQMCFISYIEIILVIKTGAMPGYWVASMDCENLVAIDKCYNLRDLKFLKLS